MSKGTNSSFLQRCSKQKMLLVMILPFFAHLVIFRYIPIWGWTMAFQDYKPYIDFFDRTWVGFKYFIEIFKDPVFYEVVRNTLAMSSLKLFTGTFGALFLAVLLNETKNKFFKSTVQTVSTLPHFIAWTVAAGLVIEALSPSTGIINEILVGLNIIDEPIMFMGEKNMFWAISTLSHLWKELGWSAIIYLAAMTGIDEQLYEAAQIDGANRIQRIIHVTIPGIQSTIVILLIISIGYLLTGGFEQQYLLKNTLNQDYARVFEIFEIEYGLGQARYSFATAAGIFRSVVSLILIAICNVLAKRFGEDSLL